MSERPIPDDATIADIVGTLNAPREYVRKILEHMYECKGEHDNAMVRIGATGEGRAPNYLIEYRKSGQDDLTKYCAYHGNGHNKIENLYIGRRVRLRPTSRSLIQDNWSKRVMTLGDVGALLGQLRGTR